MTFFNKKRKRKEKEETEGNEEKETEKTSGRTMAKVPLRILENSHCQVVDKNTNGMRQARVTMRLLAHPQRHNIRNV